MKAKVNKALLKEAEVLSIFGHENGWAFDGGYHTRVYNFKRIFGSIKKENFKVDEKIINN